MNQKEIIRLYKPESPAGDSICPFLKMRGDKTIRYGFPHPKNFCYKVKKAQPVRVQYQKKCCLDIKYLKCDVFKQDEISKLPNEILGKLPSRNIIQSIKPIHIAIFSIILIILIFLWSLNILQPAINESFLYLQNQISTAEVWLGESVPGLKPK